MKQLRSLWEISGVWLCIDQQEEDGEKGVSVKKRLKEKEKIRKKEIQEEREKLEKNDDCQKRCDAEY